VNFLLDTNVVSEPTKPQPNAQVLNWHRAQPAEVMFISVLTLGELRRGVLMLGEGARRRTLLRWLENEIEPFFEGRILNVDDTIIRSWADLQNRCRRQGCLLPVMDSLLAATALAHGLTVATRNTVDFAAAGVPVLNPWEA
jgi:predicted nucleic acid-binding protein